MNYSFSQKRHIMVMIFIIPFLMGIGIDLYAPSLPTIANHFQVNTGLVQLTIGFYVIANGIGQLILGAISDSLGRRKIILISSLFYTLVSFLSAFAPNIYVLIICRFLQGLGISGLGVVSRAVASDCFSDKELTKAMTYISIAWAIGPVLGPFIGSYLQNYFDWQANFYFFGFYGLIIFAYVYTLLPETHFQLSPLSIKEMCQNIKKVATHRVFFFGMLVLTLTYAALIVFSIIGPFLVQNVLHYSVVVYGRIALILGISYLLGNLANRILIHYLEPIKLAFFGLTCGSIISATMLILSLTITINLYIIIIPVSLLLFSCAFIFPNIQARCFSLFSQLGGTTSAVYGILITSGGFLLTLLASILPTSSQKPMVLIYLSLFLLAVILYLIMNYFHRKLTQE